MENTGILEDKRKCLRCIGWKIKAPACKSQILSKAFLFQNKKCYLEFFTGDWNADRYPFLNFKCNDKLQMPITLTLVVVISHPILQSSNELRSALSLTSASQKIWEYKNSYLRDYYISFELIFHVDCSRDDKAVQTPVHIDTNVQLEAVTKDFSNLLNWSSNHDVEFLCGEEIIKAHKYVLCCRSTVFASMLGSDMKEGKTGQIKINDMKSSILYEFLRYLYTGMFPKSTFDTILRLYEAADKYAVDSLKEQCACFLIDNLSHENACEVLIMGDRHNDPDLKKVVLKYVLEEKIPRIIGEKWKEFCKENPKLATEVLNEHYMNCSEID